MQFHDPLISRTADYVKTELAGAEAGHDWWHIQRVYNNATLLLQTEHGVDEQVVYLAALLHDIADSKFHNGDEEIGPQKAGTFMHNIAVDPARIEQVQQIIRNMSFKASLGTITFRSREMEIVQDADRLDAIGAIGIARAFTYGGYKNRELYDPAVLPQLNMTKEAYKNSTSPTINHFYEKLLLLKDQMNTRTGQRLAEERHRFMQLYLDQFFAEWEGRK
jgi:uncharacterized protein